MVATNKKEVGMEEISKSALFSKIGWAVNHNENLEGEFLEMRSKRIIKVSIQISERENFTDANGVKWVRE